MRAILIDPITQVVSEVEHTGDFMHIYTLLSDPKNGLEVDDFNIVVLNDEGETLYVDGEGLLKESTRWFFKWKEYGQPLPGRGLILGSDEAGETIATKLSLDFVRQMVEYTELSVEGFVTRTGTTELFGAKAALIEQRPIFGPPKAR